MCGQDEPQTLRDANMQNCSVGADGGQSAWRRGSRHGRGRKGSLDLTPDAGLPWVGHSHVPFHAESRGGNRGIAHEASGSACCARESLRGIAQRVADDQHLIRERMTDEMQRACRRAVGTTAMHGDQIALGNRGKQDAASQPVD